MLFQGQDPLTAVATPRLHAQFSPPVVYFEDFTDGAVNFTVPGGITAYLTRAVRVRASDL